MSTKKQKAELTSAQEKWIFIQRNAFNPDVIEESRANTVAILAEESAKVEQDESRSMLCAALGSIIAAIDVITELRSRIRALIEERREPDKEGEPHAE